MFFPFNFWQCVCFNYIYIYICYESAFFLIKNSLGVHKTHKRLEVRSHDPIMILAIHSDPRWDCDFDNLSHNSSNLVETFIIHLRCSYFDWNIIMLYHHIQGAILTCVISSLYAISSSCIIVILTFYGIYFEIFKAFWAFFFFLS